MLSRLGNAKHSQCNYVYSLMIRSIISAQNAEDHWVLSVKGWVLSVYGGLDIQNQTATMPGVHWELNTIGGRSVQPMGLDMYMYRKLYVKNWDHMKPAEKHSFLIKKGGKKRTDIKPERISEITEQVGYWRKANQIHAWMVKHVQDGKDDCEEYPVSKEQMQSLLETCQEVLDASKLVKGQVAESYTITKEGEKVPNLVDGKVIKDPAVAKKLLPTQSGFFFGGLEYNEWYLEQIQYTIGVLKEAVAEPEEFGSGEYYYQSSW